MKDSRCGLETSNSKAADIVGYLLMGRWLTLPMFIATLTSAWYGWIFGVTQIAFEHGLYGFISQGLVWYIAYITFAIFVVKRLKEMQVLSIPDLILAKYGVKSKNISAIILFFKSIPITYAISMGAFLHIVFGIDMVYGIAISCVIVTFSCSFGGFSGVVFRDIIQFCVMYIGVISVLLFSIYKFGISDYLTTRLPDSHFSISGNNSISAVILWFIVAFSTVFTSPLFYQRCIAASSKKIAKNGILISTVLWGIFDLCTVTGGMYARATMPEADSLYAYLLFGIEILPNGFKGLFLAGIVATTLSTLDAFLFVSSSIISYDLAAQNMRNLRWFRIVSVVICGVLVCLIAVLTNHSMEAMLIFLEIYIGAPLMVPIFFSYILRDYFKLSDIECVISIFIGMASVLICQYLGDNIEIMFIKTIAASLLSFYIFKFKNSIMREWRCREKGYANSR